MEPLYIRVHARDNVAIIANPDGVPAGATFATGLSAVDAIPQSHKIALQRLDEGAPVIRYGQVIGHALREIKPGQWIREDSLEQLLLRLSVSENGEMKPFEAVLRVKVVRGVPVGSELVALRKPPQ